MIHGTLVMLLQAILPATPQEALLYIGGTAFLTALASFLLERFPPFQEVSSDVRRWVVTVIILLLSFIVQALLDVVPEDTWAKLQPSYQTLLRTLTVLWPLIWAELFHRGDKAVTGRE